MDANMLMLSRKNALPDRHVPIYSHSKMLNFTALKSYSLTGVGYLTVPLNNVCSVGAF